MRCCVGQRLETLGGLDDGPAVGTCGEGGHGTTPVCSPQGRGVSALRTPSKACVS